jgi:hypothetical protein
MILIAWSLVRRFGDCRSDHGGAAGAGGLPAPSARKANGGRYMPAVHAFFDRQYGLDRGANAPLAPDGVEDFDSWKGRKKNRCS